MGIELNKFERRAFGLAACGAFGLAILAAWPSAESPFDRFEREPAAVEVRLVGYCNGRVLAAEEESAFPAHGCEWIESAVLFDGGAAWREANGRSLRLVNPVTGESAQ